MTDTSKKHKLLKILLGALLLMIVGGIIFCLVCNNLVFVLRYRDELDTVLAKINSDKRIRFMNHGTANEPKLYICDVLGNEIDAQDVDKELISAVERLFGSKRIVYVGWGVPVSGNSWEQVYVGSEKKNDCTEYLVWCKNEDELPDYSRNRKAENHSVVNGWHRIVLYGDDPTLGG